MQVSSKDRSGRQLGPVLAGARTAVHPRPVWQWAKKAGGTSAWTWQLLAGLAGTAVLRSRAFPRAQGNQ